jgi:hexosaminidase
MSKEFVLKTIDLMAQYKMNVFHWHLTEDQGWRIEIEQYPKLTEVGAWRTEEDGTRYGGYYTKQDIKEIVAYARQRHVMVIPEIELPGHSLAAIASYPELSCTGEEVQVSHEWGVFKDIYCAGNENTFIFLQNVLTEVCELFPAPYIHIGGDEAPKYRWDNCSKCQKKMQENNFESSAQLQTYFIERIAAFLKTKNKSIIGWDEILEGGIPADAMIQSWRGMEGGIAAAKAQHFVIMSPTSHCYLDYGLESINLEKVYSFNPLPDSLNAFEKTFIRGAECNMWTEHAPQEIAHSKIFPRLIALSEVLWSPKQKQHYTHFHERIKKHYTRLDAQKVKYGFEAVPYTVITNADENGQIIVQLKKNDEHVALNYKLQPLGRKTNNAGDIKSAKKQIAIKEPSTLTVNANWHGKKYDKELVRLFNPHLALGKALLLNYIPSPYYTGGGPNALVDGSLGTTSFRDGLWQAVQGNNMEAVIDLKETKEITRISTRWYHYINAWIFRPEKVAYYASTDGKTWTHLDTVLPLLDIKTEGELVTEMVSTFDPMQARYIKMVALNSGLCPEWHDAVGEPTWLFCDEIVVE